MKVDGTYQIPAPPDRVFEALQDPAVLTRCIPGCEEMEAIGEDRYKATMTVGVAAIKGTYHGTVAIVNKQPTDQLTLQVEGSGAPGFVKGQGVVSLGAHEGGTRIAVAGDAQVGGKVAAVGQRMLPGVSKKLMNEFFDRLKQELGGD